MTQGAASLDTLTSAVHRDLVYAARDAQCTLDLYLPRHDSPPMVLWIHGGAFMGGDKAQGATDAAMLLDAGFAVASMNYRLAPGTTWPGQLEDLHDAFAFLRDAAPTHGFDPARMAVMGPSAGAHLAAMAAIALALDPATRLKAAVLLYPPVDFAEMDADMAASGVTSEGDAHSDAASPESQLIGAPVGENAALAWLASPIAYLQEVPPDVPLPSMLLMHGARDPLIARGQSLRLLHALAARPTPPRLEFTLLPNGAHGGSAFAEDRTRAQVLAFLKSELGGA